MTDWCALFDPELQAWIEGLQQRGCHFVWRATESVTASTEPLDRGTAWLECWQHGRLLDFAGPLPQPLTLESLQTMQELIERQRSAWRRSQAQ